MRRAAADRQEASFSYQTTQQLAAEGIVSKIDFERAGVRRQSSEAAYQEALEEVMQLWEQLSERRAQLALARQNLKDWVIRAPFAGAITQRIASIGEYLPVNAPVARIVRQHPLRLRLEVPKRVGLPTSDRIHVYDPGIAIRKPGSPDHNSVELAAGRSVRISLALILR